MATGIAVSAVVLLCAELGLRAVGFGPSSQRFRWLADAQLQAKPAPNQDTWFCKDSSVTGESRLPLHINAFSQRGADYPLAKPAAERRVLVIGDSLTFGQGVKDDESWPAQLGALLVSAHDPSETWRAINAGVNGWSAWHYQRYVETQALRFSPDVIVVGLYFGNDMLPAPDLGSTPAWLENALRHLALYECCTRLVREQLSTRAGSKRAGAASDGAQAEIDRYIGVRESALRPREQRRLWSLLALPALERMRDVCHAADVPLVCVLLPTPLLTTAQSSSEVYGLLKDAIEGLGIPVVDPLQALSELRDKAWLPWDPGHLTPAGNARVAEAAAPAVLAARTLLSGR
jgi:lysophospholipase L1-like esterase